MLTEDATKPINSVGGVLVMAATTSRLMPFAVETIDCMTARWTHLPYKLLEKVSNSIINKIEHLSHVTYADSSRSPATIAWE